MKKYIVCGMLVLALTGLSGCQKTEVQVPSLLEPVGVEMDTAKATVGDMYTMSIYNGEVVPEVEAYSFEVDGELENFYVSVGEYVTQGQLLAKLNDEDVREKITDLEEEIADLKTEQEFEERDMAADIEIAKVQLKKVQDQHYAEEKITEKQMEVKLLELELAESQELFSLEIARLEKQAAEYKSEISFTELRAPMSGRVVYVSEAASGSRVKNQTPLICLADEENVYISSEYITPNTVKNAYKITAQIGEQEYEVTYEPLDDSEYMTMVLSGEEVTSKFTLHDENAEVESGEYVVLKIWNMYKEDVLTIPVNALHRDAKGRYVYKIVDGERIRCDVTVGITNEVKAEILEGLQEGDVVYVKE